MLKIRTALHVTLRALQPRRDKGSPPKGERESLVTGHRHEELKRPLSLADRDRLVGYLRQAKDLIQTDRFVAADNLLTGIIHALENR